MDAWGPVRAPSVRFLGGVREIGGSKILLEAGPDRILFDFGPSFDPRYEQFFLDYLQPRSTSPVRDLLEFDLIPWIPGLFSREALAGISERYEAPQVDAVFVSHAHFDHAGYLRYLDPEIPIHVAEGTRTLFTAIETSTPTRYGTHLWKPFQPRQPLKVGSLEVLPFPVDHSVPHAFGFIVRTPEGAVVYTGDFRRHGPRAKRTVEFLEAAASERPSAFIIEGTRAGPDPRKNFSEHGVHVGVDTVLARTRGLALVSCYPRDVDRIGTLYRAAVDAGRDLVVPFKTAHLLSMLAGDAELDVPVPGRDPHLKVYRRPKKTYFKWERPFLGEAVDAEWVRAHGSEVLLQLDMQQFTELIDLRPEPGTPFIRSMSEPFSEEDVNESVLKNWVAHFHLGFEQFHASGHCSEPELLEIVRWVHPEALYPIHTAHPEAFAPAGRPVVPIEKGVAYAIDGGKAIL
jgi:ribonuclease J